MTCRKKHGYTQTIVQTDKQIKRQKDSEKRDGRTGGRAGGRADGRTDSETATQRDGRTGGRAETGQCRSEPAVAAWQHDSIAVRHTWQPQARFRNSDDIFGGGVIDIYRYL